jgi:pimeloyl-ACP methyl ester carboxylesterase
MTPHASTATINGAVFAYERAGRGPYVTLVHAGIADSRMWDRLFAALARAFSVLRYDLRGFGRTPPAEGRFAHHEDLAALLRHLGIRRTSLVGCSIGSRIALDYALEHPEGVDRLALLSASVSGLPYAGPRPRQAAELDAAEEAGDLEQVNELEMQIWVDGPYRNPDQIDPGVRALAREMNAIALANEGVGEEQPLAPPAAGRLGEVRVPVLLVVGALDTPRTQAAVNYLNTGLPDARKVVIPGAAHLPNMERPEMVGRAVQAFLE